MSKDEKIAIVVVLLVGAYVLSKQQAPQGRYRRPTRVNRLSGGQGVDPHGQSPYTVANVASAAGLVVLL